MQDLDLFSLYIDKLNEGRIEYFITGSVAAIVYGEPRFTHGIDLVISLRAEQINSLIDAFTLDSFYCPPVEVIKEELSRVSKGHFNLIHHATGFKADIYLLGDDELQSWGMYNKKQISFMNKTLFIAPPEYVILKKLEFYNEGKAEKHITDIKTILNNSSDLIDFVFLNTEISKRGFKETWGKIIL